MCAETENRPAEQKREEPVTQPYIQENYDKGGASNELKKHIIQLMLRTIGSPLRERSNRQGENICHEFQTKDYHPERIKSIYNKK